MCLKTSDRLLMIKHIVQYESKADTKYEWAGNFQNGKMKQRETIRTKDLLK